MPPNNIQSLQTAIKALHGCNSRYVESVPVDEVFEGRPAWRGTVEVFYLFGHARAARAYAWQYEEGKETKTVVVLEIPPVNSPQTAVQVAVASKGTKTRERDKNA